MNERLMKQAALEYPEFILPPYDEMMDMDGFEAICAFSRNFGKTTVYIPSLRTIFGQCMEQDMLGKLNGKNSREIALRYGYSDRFVRELLKREG